MAMNSPMNVVGTVRQERNGQWRAQVSLVTPIRTTSGEATSVRDPAEAVGLATHFAWKERT